MKTILYCVALIAVALPGFAGPQSEAGDGNITVLTNRTDLVDNVFVEYAERFASAYPDFSVEFEAMTDYPGIVRIRMNTEDYGDVLLIPPTVTPQQLPQFFTPLGSVAELEQDFLGVTEMAFEGVTYGIPVSINAQGVVYNRRIWREAGVTELPRTPEQFLEALRLIRDNTDAIPYYTNYAAGWPLVQWENHRTSIAGDPDFVNTLAHTDAPFAPGQPHYILYKLLYDIVAQGLAEADPTTTDWESSKVGLNNGEIATMILGSWAIPQMQEAGPNAADIGYMPFPSNIDGQVFAAAGGDYKMGINVHSGDQEAARAFVNWFATETGFAVATGGTPPYRAEAMPDVLRAFQDLGVQFVSNNPPRAGEEGLVEEIDRIGEIGLWEPNFKARIVEAALGNRDESFDQIMTDLNERWAAARREVLEQ